MTKILPITTELGAAGIAEMAQQRLRQSPYFFLKQVRCHFEAGVLTLAGRVPYRQLKQFAESIVARVEGVQRIANHVEVVDPVLGASEAPRARSAG